MGQNPDRRQNVAPAEGESALGLLIREVRLARGLTQSQVAALAGISRKHIVSIEGSVSHPSRAAVLAMATALGADDILRDRMLDAAGYTRTSSATPLEALDEAVGRWVGAHRAQAVLVFSSGGELVEANERGSALLRAVFRPAVPMPGTRFLEPKWWSTIRRRVVHFEPFARKLLLRVVRDAALRRRERLPSAFVEAFIEMSDVDTTNTEPFLKLEGRLDEGNVRVTIVFTTAGEPPQTTAGGRTIILIVPDDEESRAVLASLP